MHFCIFAANKLCVKYVDMKMKNLVVAFCVVGFSATSVFGQIRADIGVKAGWNVSGLALNGSGATGGKLSGVSYNNRSGYHVGVYGSFRYKKLAVQPEIIYSRQGQNFTTQYFSNAKTDLKYINIPIIFKYYIAGGLNLQAGPQFGFLAGAKGDLIYVDNTGTLGQTYHNQDLKSYLKSSDLSIGFGAGLDIKKVSLTLRYNLGISDDNKYSGSNSTFPNGLQSSFSTAKTQNQVLQMSVSYRFYKLGK